MTTLVLFSLLTAPSAHAQDLVGTSVTADYGSLGGCNITATVVDPGVEFVDAGPDLCMAGSSGRLDVDVATSAVRWDFTAEQDFGFGGSAASWLWLADVNPTCPGGATGYIAGIASVSTNMDPLEWVPTLVDFTDHEVEIIGDPTTTGGDSNIRTHPGDFIDIELILACPLTLEVTGTCPGAMAIDVTGITPGSQVGIGLGSGTGSDIIPAGPCAGIQSGLSGATFGGAMTDGDFDGEIHITPNITGACGQYMQIIDRTTCETSNVVGPL